MLLEEVLIHPLKAFDYSSLYIHKHFGIVIQFKIGALRILLLANTFAENWETVVDCMETLISVSND